MCVTTNIDNIGITQICETIMGWLSSIPKKKRAFAESSNGREMLSEDIKQAAKYLLMSFEMQT